MSKHPIVIDSIRAVRMVLLAMAWMFLATAGLPMVHAQTIWYEHPMTGELPPNVRLLPADELPPTAETVSDKVQASEILQAITAIEHLDPAVLEAFLRMQSFYPTSAYMVAMTLEGVQRPSAEEIKAFEPLAVLQRAGPDAIPALVEHLGDTIPTRLWLEPVPRGLIPFTLTESVATVLPSFNPGNSSERQAYASILRNEFIETVTGTQRRVRQLPGNGTYNVRVGDVCYAVLGTIVNRKYQPARNVTNTLQVSSTVKNSDLREAVDAVWDRDNVDVYWRSSLWTDYRTVRKPSEDDVEEVTETLSWIHYGAVQRLLYYFPEEFAPRIAYLLDRLDNDSNELHASTGTLPLEATLVDLEDKRLLLYAASHSSHPLIVEALQRLCKRTDDTTVFDCLALNPAFEDQSLIIERAATLLWESTERDDARHGLSSKMLDWLILRSSVDDDRLLEIIDRYMGTGRLTRDILVAQKVSGELGRSKVGVAIGLRYLEDNRPVPVDKFDQFEMLNNPHAESVAGRSNWDVRLCDLAAATIVEWQLILPDAEPRIEPAVEFDLSMPKQQRNEAIARIQASLRQAGK